MPEGDWLLISFPPQRGEIEVDHTRKPCGQPCREVVVRPILRAADGGQRQHRQRRAAGQYAEGLPGQAAARQRALHGAGQQARRGDDGADAEGEV